MAMTVNEILDHARNALADAQVELSRHPDAEHGMCGCDRPRPCGPLATALAYERHWQARIDYYTDMIKSPTVEYPGVRR